MSTPSQTESEARAFLKQLQSTNPNILFIVRRSKNKNTVVYEWLPQQNKVDVYWIDCDPAFQSVARKKGIMTDRAELNLIERTSAYGCATTQVSATEHKLAVVPIPRHCIIVDTSSPGHPKAYIGIAGQTKVLLEFCYAHSRSVLGIPVVDFVEVFGTYNGQVVREMIKQ